MSSAVQRKAMNWPPRVELATVVQFVEGFGAGWTLLRLLVNTLKAEANQTMHPSRRIKRFTNGKIIPAAG